MELRGKIWLACWGFSTHDFWQLIGKSLNASQIE
jgi:hypothetical protein